MAAQDLRAIVDTHFDQLESGELATSAIPASDVELPLKAPTKSKAGTSSRILAGKEQEGAWSPPYAKIELVPDIETQTPPSALLEWDLTDLPVEAGRYLATFEAMVLDTSADSGVFIVGLFDVEGKSFDNSTAAYYPFVSIINKEIGSAKRQRLREGEPYLIEIMVDTQKNTWSSTINGEVVREEKPFVQSALDQAPSGFRLGKLAYATSVPGFFACKPSGSLVIKRVSLQMLPKKEP